MKRKKVIRVQTWKGVHLYSYEGQTKKRNQEKIMYNGKMINNVPGWISAFKSRTWRGVHPTKRKKKEYRKMAIREVFSSSCMIIWQSPFDRMARETIARQGKKYYSWSCQILWNVPRRTGIVGYEMLGMGKGIFQPLGEVNCLHHHQM